MSSNQGLDLSNFVDWISLFLRIEAPFCYTESFSEFILLLSKRWTYKIWQIVQGDSVKMEKIEESGYQWGIS